MENNKIQVTFEAILGKFVKDVDKAAKSTLDLGKSGKKASEDVNFDDSIDSVNRLDDGLNKVSKTLKTLVVGYAGKKLFDMGIDITADYMDYDQQIRKINTMLIGQSQEVKDKIQQDIKEIARDLKQLPEDLTGTVYDGLSASVSPERMKEALEMSIKTAIGGDTTNEVAMDVMTSVVNAYGEEVISYTEVSDQMFEAMKRGKVTIDGFADNLYSVLPAAKALEVPFYNITGALSTMTATGTPIAQATTQVGRMFLEFSREEAKASKYLKQATGKTFKELIAEGHDLQYILQIMDQVAKHLGVELNNLFNTAEAGNAAFALTGKATERFRNDLDGLKNSTGAAEAAYEEMAGGLTTLWDGIKSKFALFKLSIGEEFSDEIRESLQGVNDSLDRVSENGSLDRLAQSIGNIIATVISQFEYWINNIDKVIDKINALSSFIENRLPAAITLIKEFVKAWMLLKIIGAIEILSLVLPAATGAMGAFNAVLLANPIILIVALIGILILWIIKLSGEVGGFSNFVTITIEGLKILLLTYLKVHIWVIDKIMSTLANLTSFIPGVGTAFQTMADKSKDALLGIDSAIGNSINRIQELQDKASEGISITTNIKQQMEEKNIGGDPNAVNTGGTVQRRLKTDGTWEYIDRNKEANSFSNKNGEVEVFNVNPNDVEKIGDVSKKSKKKPKTIQDKIRDIESKHSPNTDLYTSRAELAEVRGKDSEVKQNKYSLIDVMKSQIRDLDTLSNKSSSSDKKVIEAARNKLLVKIENTLEDIKGGVKELIGNFNLPSELKTLTEYQYKVNTSTNTLTKRLIFSPDVKMYLTLEDLGNKGVDQVRKEVSNFTNAIFDDKNDLVKKFIDDVTRN